MDRSAAMLDAPTPSVSAPLAFTATFSWLSRLRATWPDERVLRGTLADLPAQVTAAGLERTALILVGPALGATEFRESALYAADYDRRFRPGVSQP